MNNLLSFQPGDRVVLTNGRFVDVAHGCYFEPQVKVVVQHGQIAAMPGLSGETEDAQGAACIDLQGRTVIPGLFNTHCHLQLISGVMDKGELRQQQIASSLADCIERGVTNIRDTLCYDLRQNQVWIENIARGEILGPRIHQAIHVGPLGGTYSPRQTLKNRMMLSIVGIPTINYHLKESGVVAFQPGATLQEVRDAVDQAIDERGAVAIKFCDQREHFMSYTPGATVMTAGQLEAAVDQAYRRGVPTTIHNVTVDGFRNSLRAGMTSLGHLPMDGELCPEDVSLLLNSKTYVEPTLTVGYYMGYSMQGSPWYGDPEIQRLDSLREGSYDTLLEESWLPELQKNQKAQHVSLRSGQMKIFGFLDLSAPFRFMAKFVPVGMKNLRLLDAYGAGERFACGTDATVSNCSQAVIHLEMELFAFALNRDGRQPFSGAEALRVATLQSAHAMGVEDRFGSIQTGKTADLVVLDGDPLQDFRLLGKPVQALFMDGKLQVNHCGLELTSAA